MRRSDVSEELNELTGQITDAAYTLHKELGPGLLERAYHELFADELEARGHDVAIEVPVPVARRGRRMRIGFRADMIVDDRVLVEIKSVEALAPVHRAQVVTYLRFTGLPVGLLYNFNVERFKDGCARVVNTRPSNA